MTPKEINQFFEALAEPSLMRPGYVMSLMYEQDRKRIDPTQRLDNLIQYLIDECAESFNSEELLKIWEVLELYKLAYVQAQEITLSHASANNPYTCKKNIFVKEAMKIFKTLVDQSPELKKFLNQCTQEV